MRLITYRFFCQINQHILTPVSPKYDDWFCQIYTYCFQIQNTSLETLNLCKSDKISWCTLSYLDTKYADLTKNNLYYRNTANGPIMQFWRDVQTLEALGIFSNTLALGLTVTCIPLAFRGKFGSLQSPSHQQRTSSLIWKRLLRSKGLWKTSISRLTSKVQIGNPLIIDGTLWQLMVTGRFLT